MVYAIVLVRDATERTGPWTFLPASVSERATRGLNYQKWRQPYRVTDERMYEHVDPAERISFTGDLRFVKCRLSITTESAASCQTPR